VLPSALDNTDYGIGGSLFPSPLPSHSKSVRTTSSIDDGCSCSFLRVALAFPWALAGGTWAGWVLRFPSAADPRRIAFLASLLPFGGFRLVNNNNRWIDVARPGCVSFHVDHQVLSIP
jgi:hypothetical protein